MSNEKENKLSPELRFPEFNSKGEWDSEALSKIAELIDERAGTKEYTTLSITSGVGLVSQKEKFGREISGSQYKNYYVIKKWDFAYNKSATKLYPEGYISMLNDIDEGAVPNSIFTCFRVNRNKIYPPFLNYLFHDNFHGKWLRSFIEVGARAHGSLNIDTDVLLRLPVVYPSIKEQQKVADCLSSLDGLISAENQKLEALQLHKKGLMQQLFPAEGERVPKLRFKEFRDSGEWEEKTISEVAKVTTGGKDTQDKIDDGKYPFFVRSQTVERIDSYSYNGEAILTSGDGVGVGKNFHYINDKFDFHQRVYCIYDFSKNVYGKFVYLYFSEHFNKRVMRMTAKNSVDSVRMAMITEMPIYLPKDKEEQQKVTDCLFSLDNLISSQSQKIEDLKAHKKGLIQKLFPITS